MPLRPGSKAQCLRAVALGLLLIVQLAVLGRPALAATAVDWSSVARNAVPAVVNIIASKISRPHALGSIGERDRFAGSGFIIDPSGIIVTNRHVVAGAFRIDVMLHDGTELPAHLIAAAAMVDLAVLKVDAGRPLPFLRLAVKHPPALGDPVLAIGNPLALGMSLSAGIVSALNRNLRNSPFDDYIQTDAAINHGNSGGPLLNTAGKVVGLDTILVSGTSNGGSNGLGFAISATVVNYVVRHLQHPNRAQVGWIGTHVQDVTSDLASAFGMARQAGCIITRVDPDSPAQRVGLHSGDVILAYNHQPLLDARAFMREVAMAPIGRVRQLTVWAQGRVRRVDVTVQAWPHLMEPRGSTGPNVQRPVPIPDFGLLLAPLTPLAQRQYGLQGVHGVLVVSVDRQSEAYGLGILPGDVIEQVEDQPVTSPGQALRLAHQAAIRKGLVAILVNWQDGPHWLTLHAASGPQPDGPQIAGGSDGLGAAAAAGPGRAPARP